MKQQVSCWDYILDSQLLSVKNHNFAIAVDTPFGLSLPVIKDVQTKNIEMIKQDLEKLIPLALDNKLSRETLSGATLTISNIGNDWSLWNVGSIGGTFSFPLITMPQVAIIALNRAKQVAIPNSKDIKDGFTIKRILPINISADHRVIDGATVAKFIKSIQKELDN